MRKLSIVRDVVQSENSSEFSFDITEWETSCERPWLWTRKLKETRNKLELLRIKIDETVKCAES